MTSLVFLIFDVVEKHTISLRERIQFYVSFNIRTQEFRRSEAHALEPYWQWWFRACALMSTLQLFPPPTSKSTVSQNRMAGHSPYLDLCDLRV